MKKDGRDTFDPVLPEELVQATGQPLYDQKGNIVLYSILYSPNECKTTSAGYQPNTIEIKTSWRMLSPADPSLSSYYVMNATIPAISPQSLTLGLVGFHLVINTKNHPEFVWATFEHKSNAPDCTQPQKAPDGGWSFTSAACAQCLAQQPASQCTQCNFNQAPTVQSPPLKGTPNQVCRAYRDGTDPESMTGGNNNDTNRANIDQLVGARGLLTRLPASSPMAVWKNYFIDPGEGSANLGSAQHPQPA